MEIQGALVSRQGARGVTSLDVARSSKFVERGLRALERRPTILHVDGHSFTQRVVKARVAEHLEDLGVGFVPKLSPAEGLRFLANHRVDLILSSSLVECQQTAGRGDGGGFLRTCKRLFPRTPFVFYTAPGTGEDDVSLADAVVFKSSDFSELVKTVRGLLRPTGDN